MDEAIYKFTALLDTKHQEAYLSGNNNCQGIFSLDEMYKIVKDTTGLNQTAPYSLWANKLRSIDDFEFEVFYDKVPEKVVNRAQTYAKSMNCSVVGQGRPTEAMDR